MKNKIIIITVLLAVFIIISIYTPLGYYLGINDLLGYIFDIIMKHPIIVFITVLLVATAIITYNNNNKKDSFEPENNMVSDNKKRLFYLSFLPLGIILLIGFVSSINGASFFGGEFYGFEAFEFIVFWLGLMTWPLLLICFIYQLNYLLNRKNDNF